MSNAKYKVEHKKLTDWSDIRTAFEAAYEQITGGDLEYECQHNEGLNFLWQAIQWLYANEATYILEKELRDYDLGYYYDDNWEEYIDEEGELLPEYEDDEFIQKVVFNKGEADWIESVTGVVEDIF